MAGPNPTRQGVALLQSPIAGPHEHVSAEEHHQNATQAKVGGSPATVYNTLNQFSDAALLRDVTFDASHANFETTYGCCRPLLEHGQRVIDVAASALAAERDPSCRSRLGDKTRSQDVPTQPDGKLGAAKASSRAGMPARCCVS
ncbi:transcriptional repressor [Mesorhizobium camelthorni]|uniref:Transcriptional repressor n=2 Tax=Allomesorhizobium camelthorni TaxID=475069 RepID=A0A6G4WEW0_9HYPH|nr:transcriptional repressor [Mesorhizobium camelthorni]